MPKGKTLLLGIRIHLSGLVSFAKKQTAYSLALTSLGLLLVAPVTAAASIAQGYRVSEKVENGSIVSLNTDQPDYVELANLENNQDLLGIAIEDNNADLVLNANKDHTRVATSGRVTVYVTDVNGPIAAGDKITSSPIAGVGMKATEPSKVVGIADEGFDGNNATETTEITDKAGLKKNVKIGSITLQIQVAYLNGTSKDTIIPAPLQRLSDAIAGKAVSVVRVILSSILLLIAIIASTIILFAGIRNSLISLGRNPLAQSSIYKGLFQVSFTSLVFMAGGLSIAYLILRI